MSFKHPEFLYLLFAILIPIIIHLFNFRRYKKLMFSNIEFLKNITTQTRKQNKLKHLIVLLLRIFAIIFIVLAFAGPEFNKDGTNKIHRQSPSFIYIDNSFSMMAEGENGRLFDEALEVARELVRTARQGSQFVLENNDPNAQRLLNKDAAQSKIDEFSISPSSKKLSSVLRNAQRFASEKGYSNYKVYLLSDFQENSFDIETVQSDSTGDYLFIPLLHLQKRNIFIDSCWLEEPIPMQGKPVKLSIRVYNSSTENIEKIPLKLSINGAQKAVAGVDIQGNNYKDINVSVSADQSGWQKGLVEIEDYPITFDDEYYFSFFVNNRINVLEIYNQSPSIVLREFYNSDTVFDFKSVGAQQVNYNKLGDHRLIILNSLSNLSSGLVNQLYNYVNEGGNLLFIPYPENLNENENRFLSAFNAGRITTVDTSKTRVVSIKSQHELFRESIVDIPDNANLPLVNLHRKFSYSISNGLETLVSLLNGDEFLMTKKLGNGQLYLLSAPLAREYTNFTTQPLYVPIMYGIAIQQNIQQKMAYVIGRDRQIETELVEAVQSETPYTVTELDSEYSFIPEQKVQQAKLSIDVHDRISNSGFYQLELQNVASDVFAFNYNRDESMMEFIESGDLESKIGASGLAKFKIIKNIGNDYSKVAEAIQKESEIWKLFLIFALLMLLAEILVLRFWK